MNEKVQPSPPEPEKPGEDAPEEPEVPLVGDIEVRKVTKLPEVRSVREKIREEFDGRSASISLSDAGIDRPASSSGRKGRGSKIEDN